MTYSFFCLNPFNFYSPQKYSIVANQQNRHNNAIRTKTADLSRLLVIFIILPIYIPCLIVLSIFATMSQELLYRLKSKNRIWNFGRY